MSGESGEDAGTGAGTSGGDWLPGGIDAPAVATGVVGGLAVPPVQFVLWQLVADGPLTGPGGGQLQAEMALFVALGVAVPAGGIALLYEDDPVSGILGAVTYPLATVAVGAVVSLPAWFYQGIGWTAGVLAVVALLEWRTGGGARSSDPAR